MTTMRRAVPFLLLALTACSSPGELVVRHQPMTPVGTTTVPVAGRYGLFIAGQDQPLFSFPLPAGAKVGFEAGATPAGDQMQLQWLYGVAGSTRGRLDFRQTYEWRRLPDQN